MTKTLLENSHRLSPVLTDDVSQAYQDLVRAFQAECSSRSLTETEATLSVLLDQLWEATEVITDRIPGPGKQHGSSSHWA